MAQHVAVVRIEQQKTAATGADELAANGAILHAEVIPLIDMGIAHATGPALLVLPMFMHQRAKLRRLTGFKKRFAFQSKLLDEMQVGDHVLVAALGLGVLILQDRSGAARETSEEKQQIVFKIEFRIHRYLQRLDIDAVVRMEGEAGQSAAGGDILILLADRFSETIDLDLASKLRQLLWLDLAHPMYVERLQQRRGEASG